MLSNVITARFHWFVDHIRCALQSALALDYSSVCFVHKVCKIVCFAYYRYTVVGDTLPIRASAEQQVHR